MTSSVTPRAARLRVGAKSCGDPLAGDTADQSSCLPFMINPYWQALTFTVQEADDRTWKRVIDTGVASPLDFCEPGREVSMESRAYIVGPRSVFVLIRRRDDRR